MLEKIWEMILENEKDFSLLNNGMMGLDIGCEEAEYCYYYYNHKTMEYFTIGLDKEMKPVYIQVEK